MQTTPGKGKGLSAANAQTPMQTSADPIAGARRSRPFTLRQQRAIDALLQGPVQTNRLPALAGVNNGPDLVAKLRRKLVLALPCAIKTVTDRDGRRIEAGEYRLTAADRSKVETFLMAQARRAA